MASGTEHPEFENCTIVVSEKDYPVKKEELLKCEDVQIILYCEKKTKKLFENKDVIVLNNIRDVFKKAHHRKVWIVSQDLYSLFQTRIDKIYLKFSKNYISLNAASGDMGKERILRHTLYNHRIFECLTTPQELEGKLIKEFFVNAPMWMKKDKVLLIMKKCDKVLNAYVKNPLLYSLKFSDVYLSTRASTFKNTVRYQVDFFIEGKKKIEIELLECASDNTSSSDKLTVFV